METLTMIQQALGDQSVSHAQVFQWHAWFKTGHTSVDDDNGCTSVDDDDGRTSVDDDEHTGIPTNCTTPETITRIQELRHQD